MYSHFLSELFLVRIPVVVGVIRDKDINFTLQYILISTQFFSHNHS